jgi:hypothetical protein
MRQIQIVFAVLVFSGFHGSAFGEDAPKPSLEMQVLEDMIGTWDEEMTNKETEWTPKVEKSKALTKRTWALGGKFMRGEGAWQPAKNDFLHVLSYDPVAKGYRSWYFDSAGTMPRTAVTAAWDEKTRTLTWQDTDDARNKIVGTHKIIDKDHTQWTLVTTSPEGKILLDLTGKCRRHKE